MGDLAFARPENTPTSSWQILHWPSHVLCATLDQTLPGTERPTVTKYLLPMVLMLALATVATPATAQIPSYTPPPNWDAAPKHTGPGGANTFICADWLSKHAGRFNEPGGPGGRDPVTNIYGPTATRGHFGAMNVGCFLTLRHRVGPPETGWFTLGEAPSWTPGP
jgi:hypothetical protein